MKVIRFERWAGGICLDYGMMPVKNIQKTLLDYEQEAKKLLDESGADHVVYGWKKYDEQDILCKVCFYQETALSDDEFYERTKSMSGVVFALHKRK